MKASLSEHCSRGEAHGGFSEGQKVGAPDRVLDRARHAAPQRAVDFRQRRQRQPVVRLRRRLERFVLLPRRPGSHGGRNPFAGQQPPPLGRHRRPPKHHLHRRRCGARHAFSAPIRPGRLDPLRHRGRILPLRNRGHREVRRRRWHGHRDGRLWLRRQHRRPLRTEVRRLAAVRHGVRHRTGFQLHLDVRAGKPLRHERHRIGPVHRGHPPPLGRRCGDRHAPLRLD